MNIKTFLEMIFAFFFHSFGFHTFPSSKWSLKWIQVLLIYRTKSEKEKKKFMIFQNKWPRECSQKSFITSFGKKWLFGPFLQKIHANGQIIIFLIVKARRREVNEEKKMKRKKIIIKLWGEMRKRQKNFFPFIPSVASVDVCLFGFSG